jgi:protein involved in polysaccharide export with SLBB domain
MLVKGDKSRDVQLQDGDVLYIPEAGPKVALAGNVKRPAIYELGAGGATVADAINWAGGFESAAELKQVVVEKNIDNTFQPVGEVTADSASLAGVLGQLPLRPADIVRVIAPGAAPVQAQVRNEYVRVSGNIAHTGVFLLRKGETLREFVARLGGPTEEGYLYAMQLKRDSVRVAQQAKLNEVVDRFEREAEATSKQRMAATVDKDAVAAIAAEAERNRQLAQRMRTVKAEGRIILELENAGAQVKNLPDVVLQDNDTIHVPRTPGTVDVLGAVFQQGSFIYKPHRNAKDYLALAGGPSVTADKSEIYILRADGTARSGYTSGLLSGIGGTEVNPGDTVVVPEEIKRGSVAQSLKDWTSIFYQFGLGAAGLKVLKN